MTARPRARRRALEGIELLMADAVLASSPVSWHSPPCHSAEGRRCSDGMMERRRSLAIRSAIGVPLSVMRRSVFVQIALPLAAALGSGVAAFLGVVALFFRTAGEPVVFPVGPLLLASAAVTVMVLPVTAVAFAVARVTRRPELLRSD